MEVGEYIRTNNGYIGKLVKKYKDGMIEFKDNEGTFVEGITDVVKHSKNIIDLIEVGDHVNGNVVYEVLDDEIELLSGKIRKKRIHFISGHLIDEEEIKSILTKEQYEQNSYKIGE